MSRSKLFNLSSSNFQFASHFERNGAVVWSPADNIPLVSWPNGRWCLEANAFILDRYTAGLARKIRGGTLATYASYLSHVIRFSYDNKISFIELSDKQFTLFINFLKGESIPGAPSRKVRDSNTVIAIGHLTLDFLAFVGDLHGVPNFVGPEGQILATRRESVYLPESRTRSGGRVIKYWHHRSLPTKDPKVSRLPIGSSTIDKLRQCIHQCSRSIFLRKRRYVLLKLLEITGGRRSEVAFLTVQSVYAAATMAEPMLELITVKGRGNTTTSRLIPISRLDLAFLLEYIQKNRKVVIGRTCGSKNDTNHLLISETTGLGLQPNTITQEISFLASAGKVSGKACPHMFRHRFITKIFVALIETHEFETPDAFRRALIDNEALKQKVRQWTGHKSLASLDTYIHFAFEEVSGFSKSYSSVKLSQSVSSIKSNLFQLTQELEHGDNPVDASRRLLALIDGFEDDLEASIVHHSISPGGHSTRN